MKYKLLLITFVALIVCIQDAHCRYGFHGSHSRNCRPRSWSTRSTPSRRRPPSPPSYHDKKPFKHNNKYFTIKNVFNAAVLLLLLYIFYRAYKRYKLKLRIEENRKTRHLEEKIKTFT